MNRKRQDLLTACGKVGKREEGGNDRISEVGHLVPLSFSQRVSRGFSSCSLNMVAYNVSLAVMGKGALLTSNVVHGLRPIPHTLPVTTASFKLVGAIHVIQLK